MTRLPSVEGIRGAEMLLRSIGGDPSLPGLEKTPHRVAKALDEMTSGRLIDPQAVLGTVFDEHSDQMVVVRGIRFVSLCEHHLLPFIGTATVGYLPNGKVIGLSKIPRLVEVLSRRLQLQERLTNQVAEELQRALDPLGVAVLMRAHHSCMGCRGVRQPDADMVTSALLGALRHPDARAEFLAIASGATL